jgi:hypothetical protein
MLSHLNTEAVRDTVSPLVLLVLVMHMIGIIFDDVGRAAHEACSATCKDPKVKVKVMLRPTVSRPVCLGVKPPLSLKTRFLLLSDISGFIDVGCPLWREDGSVFYNCCRSSPAQSFSGTSPTGLMTRFYCLRFETRPTCRARSIFF